MDDAQTEATTGLVGDLMQVVSYATDEVITGISGLCNLATFPARATKAQRAAAIREVLRDAITHITGDDYYLPGNPKKLEARQIQRALSRLLGLVKGTEDDRAGKRRDSAMEPLGLNMDEKTWRLKGYDQELVTILAQVLAPRLEAEFMPGEATAMVRVDRQETAIEIKEYNQRVRSDTVLGITALADEPGLLVFTETLGGLEAVPGVGLTEFRYIPHSEPDRPPDDAATVYGRLPPLRANESCTVSWTTNRFGHRQRFYEGRRVIEAYGDVDIMAAYDLPLLVLRLRFDKPAMMLQYYEHYESAPGGGLGKPGTATVTRRHMGAPSADGTEYSRQFHNVKKLHHYGMTWLY
jgi:hypothetical protein